MEQREDPVLLLDSRIPLAEMFVDATPDGRLALRILEAYKVRSQKMWRVEGMDPRQRLVYEAMNEHQVQRVAELERALSILRGSLGN